jgi:hypothetical protein
MGWFCGWVGLVGDCLDAPCRAAAALAGVTAVGLAGSRCGADLVLGAVRGAPVVPGPPPDPDPDVAGRGAPAGCA